MMTVADIFDIILKRIKILIIIPLLCFAASMFYSYELVAPTYTASTTFMVLNQTYYDSITYNDLMIGEILLNDYQYLATTKTVSTKAAESLGLKSLRGCSINVNGISDTRMISLSVTCTEPEKAANVANALTEELTKRIAEIMKVDNITVVEQATVPTTVSGPNHAKIVISATAVGMLIAIGVVLLLEFMDNTIKTGEDVEKYLGVPLLAQIDKIEEDKLEDD